MNDELDDVSVLVAIQRMITNDVLNDEDCEALLNCIKSDWGRTAAAEILTNNLSEQNKSALKRYSMAFH